MNDQQFLRCNCESCGSPIEFPAQGVGLKIHCPHCGQETLLSESAETLAADVPLPPPEVGTGSSAPPLGSTLASPVVPQASLADAAACPQCGHGKKSRLLAGAISLVVLAALAGGAWYFMAGPGSKKAEAPVAKSALTNRATDPSTPTNPATNPPSGKPMEPGIPVAAEPKRPKSIDDLKPGTVTLEKAKSGSLVHAVGTIKNTSDQQRFGVRVELELTDANGKPAGKASDYTQVIEPRQEWRFRALVLDPKGARAVAGKVSSIKEDN
ncbi:MAG TPA: FxLYD domain-containing protein [Verrucomicrobiae bacterium]|nr:FxLYD domain-containing protein [Verrucomicrobiae bacterium]